MTAEELRIGNLYESVKWKKPVYCTMEDMYELVCRADGAKVDHIEINTLFNPIPLTEEWLEKFGRKAETRDDFYRLKQHVVIKDRDGDWHFHAHSMNPTMPCCYIGIIKFVHQLQNLYFALTGEELTTN